ncbi:MAG: hypothetical protein EXR72_05640 [Myxococcales bacterium]|nr:hypothetical protein [Myxococcales bacterium]
MEDRYDMLFPTEKAKADQFIAQHRGACPDAEFVTAAAVSGYGYRIKVLCRACGKREDVSDEARRDPYPHR